MDSFYGGLAGASFIIVKKFDAISVPSTHKKRTYYRVNEDEYLYTPLEERTSANWHTDGYLWKQFILDGTEYKAIDSSGAETTVILSDEDSPVYKIKYYRVNNKGKFFSPLVERTSDNWANQNWLWREHELDGSTDVNTVKIEEDVEVTGDPVTFDTTLAEGMVECFKQGQQTNNEVGYGEYVLIDSISDLGIDSSPDNGKVYRRGFDYENDMGGAEYIGCFRGSDGECPELSFDLYDNIKGYGFVGEYGLDNDSIVPGLDNDGQMTYTLSDEIDFTEEPTFPTTGEDDDIILITDSSEYYYNTFWIWKNTQWNSLPMITDPTTELNENNVSKYYYDDTTKILQQVIVNGSFNDTIQYAWVTVRNLNGSVEGCKIGFKVPYLYHDFKTQQVSAYYNRNDIDNGQDYDKNYSNSTNDFTNKGLLDRTDDKTHPYFQGYKINIPRGIKGTSITSYKIQNLTYIKTSSTHAGQLATSKINLINNVYSTKELEIGKFYSIFDKDNYKTEDKTGINYYQLIIDNIPYFILTTNINVDELSNEKTIFNLDKILSDNVTRLTTEILTEEEEKKAIIEYITYSYDSTLSEYGFSYDNDYLYDDSSLSRKYIDTITGEVRFEIGDTLEIKTIDTDKKYLQVKLTKTSGTIYGDSEDVFMHYPEGKIITSFLYDYENQFDNYDTKIYTDLTLTTESGKTINKYYDYDVIEVDSSNVYIKLGENQYITYPNKFETVTTKGGTNNEFILYQITDYSRVAEGDYYYQNGGPYNNVDRCELTDNGDLILNFNGSNNYNKHIRWLNNAEAYNGTDMILTYNDQTSKTIKNAFQRITEAAIISNGHLLLKYNVDPVGTIVDKSGNIWTEGSGDKYQDIGKVVGNPGFGIIGELTSVVDLQAYELLKQPVVVGSTAPSSTTTPSSYYAYKDSDDTIHLYKYSNGEWVEFKDYEVYQTEEDIQKLMPNFTKGAGAPSSVAADTYYYDTTNFEFYYGDAANKITKEYIIYDITSSESTKPVLSDEFLTKLQTTRVETILNYTNFIFDTDSFVAGTTTYFQILRLWQTPYYCPGFTNSKLGWAYSVTASGKNSLYYYDWDECKWFPILIDSLTAGISQYYYIDCVNGSDKQEGTSLSFAFKTIQHALDVAKAYNVDVILVDRGENNDYYLDTDSTAGKMIENITFRSCDTTGTIYSTSDTTKYLDITIKNYTFTDVDIFPESVNLIIDNSTSDPNVHGTTTFTNVNLYNQYSTIKMNVAGDTLALRDSKFYILDLGPSQGTTLSSTCIIDMAEMSTLSVNHIRTTNENIKYLLANSTLISRENVDVYDWSEYMIAYDHQSQIITYSSRSVYYKITLEDYTKLEKEDAPYSSTNEKRIEYNRGIEYIIATQDEIDFDNVTT